MRNLFAALVMLAMSNIISVAYSYESSISTYQTIASDLDNIVQNGYGFQVSLHKNNWYVYTSIDKNPVRFSGQSGTDIDIYSIGVGFEHTFGKEFNLFFDVGWYEPKYDGSNQDVYDNAFETTLAEGLWIHLNNKLAGTGQEYKWQYYTLEYNGNIGGKIGLEYSKPIFKSTVLNISARYRYLSMGEMIKGINYEGFTSGWWEYKETRDFSGWQISIGVIYEF